MKMKKMKILKSILCFYSHLVQGDVFLHNLKRDLKRAHLVKDVIIKLYLWGFPFKTLLNSTKYLSVHAREVLNFPEVTPTEQNHCAKWFN